MEKKYTRKPIRIRNLTELETVKEKTRKRYKNIEADWVSSFVQPENWLFSLGEYFLTGFFKKQARKKSSGNPKNKKRAAYSGQARKFSEKRKGIIRKMSGLGFKKRRKLFKNSSERPSRTTRVLHKILWGFIYWQAFNIGFSLGRKCGKAIRRKRH